MARVVLSGPPTAAEVLDARRRLAEREAEVTEAAATAVCLIESFESATQRALSDISVMRGILSSTRPMVTDLVQAHREREEAIERRIEEQNLRTRDASMLLDVIRKTENERDRARKAIDRFQWSGPDGSCPACRRPPPEHATDCEIGINLPDGKRITRPRR